MLRRTLLAAAALAVAGAGAALAQDPVKVGFVLVGPKNDGGWSQHHYESAKKMEAHFGDKIEMVVQESVPEGADAERVMTQMALSGVDIIFTTSFGYMDPTINVAAKFPDVKFEHATGYKTAPNVGNYSARFYEGRAVMGHLAGKMTKSNIVGYIASFPIPEVIRGINSSFIHARKANPDIEMNVVWIFTWFDPAKEADAARRRCSTRASMWCSHIPIPQLPWRSCRKPGPMASVRPPIWPNTPRPRGSRRSSMNGPPITSNRYRR